MVCIAKLLGVLITCSCTHAMPMSCIEDEHCPSGFYCDTSQLFCRECLLCQDLKRQPSPIVAACVTSVAECGPCLPGLVQDNIDNQCVSPPKTQLLPYEWAVIAVSLVLAILVCAAAAYVLRNFHTFKIRASTRTSVHSPNDSIATASAPQPPPPYNVVAALPPATQCEESLPFIKPVSLPHRTESRESAGSQSARVFNNPSYVRTLQPSYEIPTDHDETMPTIQENIPDNEQYIRSVSLSTSANSVVSQAEGSTANVLSPAPPTKLLRVGQDSNNNRDDDVRDNSSSQPPLFAHSGTAFIINVIKNVSAMQQRNEVTL